MAHGLVPVSTHANGTAAYINRGRNGNIFRSDDPQSLAAILKSYVQSPETIRQHGQAAYQRVVDYYSPAIFSKRITSILQDDE